MKCNGSSLGNGFPVHVLSVYDATADGINHSRLVVGSRGIHGLLGRVPPSAWINCCWTQSLAAPAAAFRCPASMMIVGGSVVSRVTGESFLQKCG